MKNLTIRFDFYKIIRPAFFVLNEEMPGTIPTVMQGEIKHSSKSLLAKSRIQ